MNKDLYLGDYPHITLSLVGEVGQNKANLISLVLHLWLQRVKSRMPEIIIYGWPLLN